MESNSEEVLFSVLAVLLNDMAKDDLVNVHEQAETSIRHRPSSNSIIIHMVT